MQVNSVHALLALLRQHRPASGAGEASNSKISTVEELVATAKSTNMRLAMLEQLLRERSINVQDAAENWQNAAASALTKKPFVKLASTTSDAINKTAHERHGRSWFHSSTQQDHSARFADVTDENDPVLNSFKYFEGVALPFRPSNEDIERALQSGTKVHPELAMLAKRMAFEASRDSMEANENRINFYYFLIGAAVTAFALFLIYR